MLRGIFAPSEQRSTLTDWGVWPGDYTPASSGQRVNATTSLQLLTVYGCVKLITDSISTLPVDCYRKTPDGREPLPTPAWLKNPTIDLDFAAWCGQVLMSLLLHGNAYLAVSRSATMGIVEVTPLDPTRVTVTRDGVHKAYLINGIRYTGEIVHLKGLMMPGSDVGLSPIESARQSIGLGLATQEYGGNFFGAGEGNMPGVIEMPTKAQPETMRTMAEAWRRKRSKGGRGLPAVLESGATWKPTGVTNEQAQFLATRGYTAAEIAGQMFLVDPSDLGIPVQGTSLTYANLEQRNIRRVQVTLLPWIVRLETAISGLLFNPRYMKFNVEGILRGDTKTRWETYQIAENINASAASQGEPPVLLTTEMREFEDLAPLPAPQEVPT